MRQKQQDAFPFVVDESSDVPLWVQLRQRIMHLISTGYFKPGDKLPTVRGLAQEVSINYNTVNKAYLSLVSDGILESARGRGVFVRDVVAEEGAEHAQEVEGILDDCISACRDLGLSLEDIQQHMTRRTFSCRRRRQAAKAAARARVSCAWTCIKASQTRKPERKGGAMAFSASRQKGDSRHRRWEDADERRSLDRFAVVPQAHTEVIGEVASSTGVLLFSCAVFAVVFCVVAGIWFAVSGRIGAIALVAAALASVLACMSVHIAQQWERVVVLRFGKLNRVSGPGLFWTIPVIEQNTMRVDGRTRVTAFGAEETLASDLVPLNVNAVLFWMVYDAEAACTEVGDFTRAVELSAQTALRDAIGRGHGCGSGHSPPAIGSRVEGRARGEVLAVGHCRVVRRDPRHPAAERAAGHHVA